jgi:MSHA pilin protein MshD
MDCNLPESPIMHGSAFQRQQPARRGFGMAEVVVATAIVGVMIVGALEGAGMVARSKRLVADRLTGPGLAHDLMAEILTLPYVDPNTGSTAIGPDAGESSRVNFDDVDDYHNWTSVNAVARDGSARSGYTGWSQTVAVAWASRTDTTTSGSDTNLKRITVTVTSPTGEATQVVALRARYGALERDLPIATTAVRWSGIELRAGASTRAQFGATSLTNLATDAN